MNIYTEENFLKEKNKLNSMNSFIIIEYIKSTIDILVDFKVNKQIQNFFNDYNLNNNNNNIHLKTKIEQETQIYIKNLKRKLNEMEKSKNEYKKSFMNLQEVKKYYNFFTIKIQLN
jgi:hypothetical protein